MTDDSAALFLPCENALTYAEAARLIDDVAAPVPFICTGRTDLILAARHAASLYQARRQPPCADVGIILPPDKDRLRVLTAMLAPLARRWERDICLSARTGPQSVLVVGLYENLKSEYITPLLDRQRGSRAVYLLTGRDIASLSWMLAKQYVQTAAAADALLSDVSRNNAIGAAEVLGSSDFASQDVAEYLHGKRWRRILFHGHGKDDYLNLGDWTLCGLHETAPVAGPVTLQPRCGYGYPCFKPAEKLIKISGLTAAEIVLSSCNSGALPDSAFYDSRYQLLLSSIDGTPQSVVAAARVHDSGAPENSVFMRAAAQPYGDNGSAPNTTENLNASVADMHPYIPFLQYGFPVPDLRDSSAAPPVLSTNEAVDPYRELLAASVERALMWLDCGILPGNHPLRPRLAKFVTRYFDAAALRHLKDFPVAGRDLQGDLQSLDYAMVRRVIQDPEDPIMHSLEYWGKRSRIVEPASTTTVCGCGRSASEFSRTGIIRAIPDTVCVACARCGYAHMRMVSGLSMTTYFPASIQAGESAVATVRISGGRASRAQLGIFVPSYLRDACEATPAAAKVTVIPSGEVSAHFTLQLDKTAIPQIYYYTVVAVQDLSVALVRTHFGLFPPGGDASDG